MSSRVTTAASAEEKLLEGLAADELLVRCGWRQWRDIEPPFREVDFSTRDVTTRFRRNGYDWDVHGTLYLPQKERPGKIGFVLLHGGAGSEKEVHETPDGRLGLAAVLASQGYRALAITYPGHYPPGGEWKISVVKRQPVYLLDRQLPMREIRDRNLKCTYNVIVEGAARLTDKVLGDYKVMAFGHSTGGPMSVSLQRFLKRAEIMGIVGWASGGPDGWYREWVEWVGAKGHHEYPLDSLARRDAASFRRAGYEDLAELCPWGGAEGYMAWGDKYKSQMKTGLCDNQHGANVELLKAYARRTGLPESEYLDHLHDPDPHWLARTNVLLLVGENDRNHWFYGKTIADKLEIFMGEKFAQRTPRTRVVLIPRYGHFGYVGLHNEKIVYTWLWALKYGYFAQRRT